jgi:hydroxypyruvate isomerase
MKLKQSISWWCYIPNLLTPEALLDAAVEIGYAGIELVDPPYWQMIKDHGLTITSIKGHGSITEGLNRRENFPPIMDDLKANLDLAVKWGIPNLICFSGNRNRLDDRTGAEITTENLRQIAPLAEAAGVNLVIELLNSKVDHPDYQCDSTAWGIQVCEWVNSPRVKLLYDIYHMQIMEGDVIRTIQTHHRHFGHYHTAGNPGRHEIDDRQELNYPAIVRAITATGYKGFLGQEFIPVDDPIQGLKRAFDLCNVV